MASGPYASRKFVPPPAPLRRGSAPPPKPAPTRISAVTPSTSEGQAKEMRQTELDTINQKMTGLRPDRNPNSSYSKLSAQAAEIKSVQKQLAARDQAIALKNQPVPGQKDRVRQHYEPQPQPMLEQARQEQQKQAQLDARALAERKEKDAKMAVQPKPVYNAPGPVMGDIAAMGKQMAPQAMSIPKFAKGGYVTKGMVVNKGVGASMKPHNVFGSKGKK